MKHFYAEIDGWFWFQTAYDRLLDTLPTDRPSIWVELGVYKGRSLAYVGVEVLNRGLDCQVYGVDIFPSQGMQVAASNLSPLGEEAPTLILGGSAQSARTFQDGEVDVVWVDADHGFPGVWADIDAWWPKVRKGGYMGGDDYEMRGVAQAVEAHFSRNYELGIGYAHEDSVPRPYPWWLVRK